MNTWKQKDWKSSLDSDAITTTYKPNSRRARLPNLYELLAQLDAVDLRLLQWLLRYPFQRAEDLALTIGSSLATVYRRLNMVYENNLVERLMPAALGTAKCWVYHLSNLGLHVLALHELTDPAELATRWRTGECGLLRLLPRVASLMTLQDCINGLVAHAPEALSHQGRRSEVRWHWMRDYTHRFSYRGKMMRCTADAALLLRVRSATENGTSVQDKWYSLFVLLDSEIAGDTWLEQRTGRLLCYRESAECWSVYQHFPMVLVLVSTPHRMEHWQWCAMGAATALHVVPLLGALACLPEKQSLGSFNPWRLAWKALGKGGPCTLRHVLHSLPVEAIPPELWNQHTTHILRQKQTLTTDTTSTIPTSSRRNRTRIIGGNYMERAKAVQIDHIFDSPDERENMAMLGLNLGQRHFELLPMLFAHPLLSVREIAALLELETSSIKRYLSVLRGSGCIESLATVEGQRWRLCERGLRLIATRQHINVKSIAIQQENGHGVYLVQQGVDVLLRHVEHTAGIYGFFASLSQAAREERLQGCEHRLLWWETGAACERSYRYREHWHNLRPDAIAEYQAGEKRVRFWLEWDRGTMSSRDLAVKCRTYTQYVASREWFKQEAALPTLLVVTPDPGQERRLGRVVTATLPYNCGLIIRTTTLSRVREQGLLSPIWDQVPPNSEGNALVPRRTFYL